MCFERSANPCTAIDIPRHRGCACHQLVPLGYWVCRFFRGYHQSVCTSNASRANVTVISPQGQDKQNVLSPVVNVGHKRRHTMNPKSFDKLPDVTGMESARVHASGCAFVIRERERGRERERTPACTESHTLVPTHDSQKLTPTRTHTREYKHFWTQDTLITTFPWQSASERH